MNDRSGETGLEVADDFPNVLMVACEEGRLHRLGSCDGIKVLVLPAVLAQDVGSVEELHDGAAEVVAEHPHEGRVVVANGVNGSALGAR